jgi:protein-ribulosamine 3-kinase
VRDGVEDALARLGIDGIREVVPVSGGCINHGARVDGGGRRSFFLKWNASAPPRLFDAEADGLRALGEAAAVRVPAPVARGGGSGAPSWLLMEYIAPGTRAADFDERLGRALAALHRSAPPDADVGWHIDNWIGSLPQSNRSGCSWAAFWRDERIVPQLARARESGHLGGTHGAVMDRVVEAIPAALADVDSGPAHLLHGDLWSGNAFAGPGGEPVIIDPAVYHGHGEVDLAMTELFGGFGADFYAAYGEAAGVTPAYRAYRRDLYQLYYLLVHLNLFGESYETRALQAAERVLSELGR